MGELIASLAQGLDTLRRRPTRLHFLLFLVFIVGIWYHTSQTHVTKSVHHTPIPLAPTADGTIAICRVITNSVPGIHSNGQSYRILAAALERDRQLGLSTHQQYRTLWAVNRIVDKEEEKRMVRLLEFHHEEHIVIPYDELEYLAIPYDWAAVSNSTDRFSDPFGIKLSENSIPDVIHERAFAVKARRSKKIKIMAKVLHKKIRYLVGTSMARDLLAQIAKTEFNASWIMMTEPDTFFTTHTLATIAERCSAEVARTKLFIPTAGYCPPHKDEVPLILQQSLSQPKTLEKDSISLENGRVVESIVDRTTDHPPTYADDEDLQWFTPQLVFRREAEVRFDWYPRHAVTKVLGEIDNRAGISSEIKSLLETWKVPVEGNPFAQPRQPDTEADPVGMAFKKYCSDEPSAKKMYPDWLEQMAAVQDYAFSVDGAIARKLRHFDGTRLFHYDQQVLAAEKQVYRSHVAATIPADMHDDADTDGATEESTSPLPLNPALHSLITKLIGYADEGLHHGPFSVVWKEEYPPSNDKHDYFTPAPYFWPDPDKPDGLPYIRRDGERVPGTELYDAFSNRYDRSRIASMFGNTTVLTLAFYFTDDVKYGEKAAENIRVWFINPETRMNPNMRYAQIQRGSNGDVGASFGVIETRDLFYLLDMVRILHKANILTTEEIDTLKQWLRKFSQYLLSSNQGRLEYSAVNNHGTFFDVQLASIAAFLDDEVMFVKHSAVARSRMHTQFAPDGRLPHEMERPTQLHYMMFGLMGWMTLSTISDHGGFPLWNVKTDGRDLAPDIYRALKFTVPHFNRSWNHPQNVTEDMERMDVLYHMGQRIYKSLQELEPAPEFATSRALYTCEPMFMMHDGIPPFWNLGLLPRKDYALPTEW